MNITKKIKSFFGEDIKQVPEDASQSEKIIEFVASLASQPQAVEFRKEKMIAAKMLPSDEKLKAFLEIYKEIIEFLLHKDPVRRFTEIQIKELITKKFKFEKLDGGIPILFQNEENVLLTIGGVLLNEILRNAAGFLHQTTIADIVRIESEKKALKDSVQFADGKVTILSSDSAEAQKVIDFMPQLFIAIYEKVKALVGDQPTVKLFENCFAKVNQTYAPFIANSRQVVSFLPSHLLANERMATLSRAGLEEKLREQAKLLQAQLELTAKRNKDLENSKRAMLNLLEDAHSLEDQLRHEKENVEKKVEERTSALLEAKDEISRGWLQIQQEKIRLTASINSLSLGFIMTDQNGHVLISNPALIRILNLSGQWSLSEIATRFTGNIKLMEQLAVCIHQRKIVSTDKLTYGPKYLKLYMSPIISQENSVIGTVILIEDITDAKVLERSRDEFFSIASHELRTPLTSIKGNSSMIEEYYADSLKDESLREMISDIHESSVRLIDIVNDFLDVSRLEQGRLQFKKEVFDIVPLIEKVLYDLKVTSGEKKIYVNFNHAAATHPLVVADSARTKQIVYNILGNSIKFTDQGGVTVSLDVSGGFLNIHITDTGKGIPVTSQALLFRKFQQAENNILTRDNTKGTGLGLYISKLMAEGMGGTIVLERSVEGQGSTFLIRLPIAQNQAVVGGIVATVPQEPASKPPVN